MWCYDDLLCWLTLCHYGYLLAAMFFSTRLYNPMSEFHCFMFTLFFHGIDEIMNGWIGWIYTLQVFLAMYFGHGPFPVTVTTRIIPFLAANPYKPLFATITGKGPHPRYNIDLVISESSGFFPRFTWRHACSLGGSQVLDLGCFFKAPWFEKPANKSQGITTFFFFFFKKHIFWGTTKVHIVDGRFTSEATVVDGWYSFVKKRYCSGM